MGWHELVHELEIIPAGECFLAGVIMGMVIVLAVMAAAEGGKK